MLDGGNGVSLTLTANNLSSDLLDVISAYHSGAPISDVLSQSISGQINSLVLDDAVSGTSVGLHFTNTDGDVQNAEELALDVAGTRVVLQGSIPRDIGSIWGMAFEDTHVPIIDKLEAAGHNIDGFRIEADGRTIASAGTDGIYLEANYQVPGEATIGGSPRALQFHLDTQIEDLSAMTGTFSGIRISDVLLDPSGTVVEEEVALSWSTSEISIAVADIELAIEGSFSNRLESIDNLDTADVTSASLSAGEQGARVPLVTATNVAGMPDTPFNLREGNSNVGDYSNVQQGIRAHDNWENLIGTSHDDILVFSNRGSIIMAGDGDDLLGYETPWYSWEWIDELNILSGGAGADTFYIPVNAYQEYEILLDDFNPLEDKIVLNPSRAGAGFTGYELSADGIITFTYENAGYIDGEPVISKSRVVLPDAIDLNAASGRIEIGDLYEEIYENDQLPWVDLDDDIENGPDNWQYNGPSIPPNNNAVIYGTRWDDTIIGGDADQDIYIIGGENFIHGKGGTDTVHIDGLRDDFSLVNFDGQLEVISASQTQTLEDVEFLRFDDETVDLSTSTGCSFRSF